jgi:hypothetical protein
MDGGIQDFANAAKHAASPSFSTTSCLSVKRVGCGRSWALGLAALCSSAESETTRLTDISVKRGLAPLGACPENKAWRSNTANFSLCAYLHTSILSTCCLSSSQEIKALGRSSPLHDTFRPLTATCNLHPTASRSSVVWGVIFLATRLDWFSGHSLPDSLESCP